jgi:hypothetical protein
MGEATRLNLPPRRDQLNECLRQVESARKQYRRGNAAPPRILWRDLAGNNIREQVRFASGDLPPKRSGSL